MWRIFTGANGYYVAWEANGYHQQPPDNGARLGWNHRAAKAELTRLEQEEREEVR